MNTTTSTDTPNAWIGCLSCYNSGSLFGKWIEGTQAADLEAAGLAKVQTVGDYTAPRCVRCFGDEFAVLDHENYHGFIKGECSTVEAQEAAELIESIQREGIEIAAAGAWISFTGQAWNLDSFQDSYQGERDSFQDYAEELARELHGEQLDAARWPFSCINWEHAARELSYDYHTEEAPGGGVFIFRNC
jgi:antirestriction protein